MTYWKYRKMGPFWSSSQPTKCSVAGGNPSSFTTSAVRWDNLWATQYFSIISPVVCFTRARICLKLMMVIAAVPQDAAAFLFSSLRLKLPSFHCSKELVTVKAMILLRRRGSRAMKPMTSRAVRVGRVWLDMAAVLARGSKKLYLCEILKSERTALWSSWPRQAIGSGTGGPLYI